MIYRNSLGNPESRAYISVFGGNYGQPGTGYFSLTSPIVDLDSRKWDYTSKDVSGIVAEMESEGWNCIVTADGYNAPKIELTHIETQAVIDQQKKENEEKFDGAVSGYIRFGNLPKDGKSINHRDNIAEAGVSAFRAEFAKSGEYRLIVSHVEKASYYSVCDRPAYRLYGKEVGTGADGEPVLTVEKAVKINRSEK